MSLFQRLARSYVAPAAAASGGLRLAFDIEADGLLNVATTVHCAVIIDLDSDRIHEYGPGRIADALAHLARADYLTGLKIQDYDLPLLRRLHGWAPPAGTEVVDMLVAGRLILPNLGDLDDQVAAMGGPKLKKLRGRYSIEAWGARLGVAKDGTDIEDFSAWTPELQARCVGDAEIARAIWRLLQPDGYSAPAMALEHRVNAICDRIEADGVPFDDAAAARLEQRWSAECTALEARLRDQFPGMNPNSRAQIARQLEARGWVAEERTAKTGQPKIDDALLEAIPQLYPEFADLTKFHILRRRIAQLSKGAKAWRKHVGEDNRIHGGIVHIGTPHGRASHFSPNLAQVPNPKRGTPHAAECRALFRAPEGWVFVVADQATLQDRAFAHYLTEFDNGAYAEAFLRGADQHWKGAIILDLIAERTPRDEHNKVHEVAREGAKGFRYGFLFGCQSKRAGQIIGKIVRGMERADPGCDLRRKFFARAAHPNEDALRRVGRRALDKFEAGTPGLRQLRQKLQSHARQHGWLPGLDGRRVPVRALYSTLNFIVSSAEAVICKRWLVQVYDELHARFRYGWDGKVVIALWIHDELVCCCRSEIAAEVGETMIRHAREAGAFYELKVPLDAGFTVGRSWADADGIAENAEHVENIGLPRGADADGIVEHAETSPRVAPAGELRGETRRARRDASKFSNDLDEALESAFAGEAVDGTAGKLENGGIDGAAEGGDVDVVADEALIAAAATDAGSPSQSPPISVRSSPPPPIPVQSPPSPMSVQSSPPVPVQSPPPSISVQSPPPPESPRSSPPPESPRSPPPESGGNGRGDGFDNFTGAESVALEMIHCPLHDDKTPSCQLYSDGHFFCFGCHEYGAIEDLDLDDDALAKLATRAEAKTASAAWKFERALKLWDEGEPIAGTLAARYLTDVRKLDLAALPTNVDEVLRFHPRCAFGGNGAQQPCLLALFRDVEDDSPAGIHRIRLTPPRNGELKRRTLGQWSRPRAIKLWPATNRLTLGEGIETVLGALCRGAITPPVWAMGSRVNIANFPTLPGVKALTILVDNDGGKALPDAEACAERYLAADCRVRMLITDRVKDFNDLVMS